VVDNLRYFQELNQERIQVISRCQGNDRYILHGHYCVQVPRAFLKALYRDMLCPITLVDWIFFALAFYERR